MPQSTGPSQVCPTVTGITITPSPQTPKPVVMFLSATETNPNPVDPASVMSTAPKPPLSPAVRPKVSQVVNNDFGLHAASTPVYTRLPGYLTPVSVGYTYKFYNYGIFPLPVCSMNYPAPLVSSPQSILTVPVMSSMVVGPHGNPIAGVKSSSLMNDAHSVSFMEQTLHNMLEMQQ